MFHYLPLDLVLRPLTSVYVKTIFFYFNIINWKFQLMVWNIQKVGRSNSTLNAITVY
jgi:hypothetical protein